MLPGSELPPAANLVVLGLLSAGITNLAVIMDLSPHPSALLALRDNLFH